MQTYTRLITVYLQVGQNNEMLLQCNAFLQELQQNLPSKVKIISNLIDITV